MPLFSVIVLLCRRVAWLLGLGLTVARFLSVLMDLLSVSGWIGRSIHSKCVRLFVFRLMSLADAR